MPHYSIYVLESNKALSKKLIHDLGESGYFVRAYESGASFLKAVRKEKPNMAIIDLHLDDMPGMDALKAIRQDPSNKCIYAIVISKKCDIVDKVEALDMGADEFIEEPYNKMEFLSIVNANVRRATSTFVVSSGPLSYDFDTRTLKNSGSLVDLTPSENKVVYMLFSSKGEVVEKSDIMLKLYGDDDPSLTKKRYKTIDMHIRAIRNKIGDKKRTVIRTFFNHGYKVA